MNFNFNVYDAHFAYFDAYSFFSNSLKCEMFNWFYLNNGLDNQITSNIPDYPFYNVYAINNLLYIESDFFRYHITC